MNRTIEGKLLFAVFRALREPRNIKLVCDTFGLEVRDSASWDYVVYSVQGTTYKKPAWIVLLNGHSTRRVEYSSCCTRTDNSVTLYVEEGVYDLARLREAIGVRSEQESGVLQ